ncbi:MAG: PHP domain-containing protein [Clostridiales bacterium]|nr:PHP domain-containing protein [Candidatus Apopatousia equi]
MVLFGDYHTHTVFSHGKGTIEDNVKVAVEKGLKQIAITDHGFNHGLYAVKREKVKEMRAEVERLKKVYDIDILLGIEANLISYDGTIDLTEDEIKLFDIILVGYHKTFKAKTFKDRILFILRSLFPTKRAKRKNTMAYINCLNKYDIDTIVHLNYGFKVNAVEIAKLAKEKHTYIELNGKRTEFPKNEVEEMVKNETMFIIDSDAHTPQSVGEVNHPHNFMIMNNIPSKLVVNYNGQVQLKNHKG